VSKNVALFIDVANIYYAARGQDVDVDYVALLKHVTKGRDLIRAYAYSGLDPENENQRKFLDFLSKNDYKVVHKDIRKFGDGRVKANLDIELVVDLFRLAPRMDIAVIVSGDGDFASAIRALQDVGVRCEVISFRPNTSSDLIAVADEFTDIMKITGIGRSKGSRHMSMPEMPAKEVNPEFGFREASRGVAQAAIAALRGDEKTARPSRRRTSKTAEVSASARSEVAGGEPAEVAEVGGSGPVEPAAPAQNGEGARRRRRRRGGRGRGRGRRSGEQAAPVATNGDIAPAAEGDIGWEEFDDLSELGDLTDLGEPGAERTYAFEEADSETLAALGLESPESARTVEAAEPATEPAGDQAKPAPRRRAARGRKTTPGPVAEATGDEAARGEAAEGSDAGEAAPARGRRTTRAGTGSSRRRKTPAAASEEPASEPGDAQETAAASGRKTRSRKTVKTEAAGDSADEAPAARGATRRTGTRRSSATAARAGRRAGSGSDAGGTRNDAPEAEDDGSVADEGIWQRFRSGRTGSRGARKS
jgi:uncharacterized LabA/DUF88 family protein